MNKIIGIIDFSLDYNQEIESINIIKEHEVTDEGLVTILIKELTKDKLILLSEGKTEGSITFYDDNTIEVDYKGCDVPGEDWGDDEWEDRDVISVKVNYTEKNEISNLELLEM